MTEPLDRLNTSKPPYPYGETLYRALLQTASDAIITIDQDETIFGFNIMAEKIFGYKASEVFGRNVEILMPERYRERHHKAINNVMGRGHSPLAGRSMEHKGLRKDGSEFPLSITMSAVKIDGRYTFLAIIRDITERKIAEDALKTNEERLKRAQHIARVGSWEWDIVNNALYWSDEIYRIFGLTPQEFGATYESFINAVHPDDREFVKDSVLKALNEKIPYNIEHKILLPDGSERIVHEQADVNYNQIGIPVHMAGTVQDITEQKKIELAVESIARFPSENPNPVLRVSDNGTLLYANSASQPILEELGSEVNSKLPEEYIKIVRKAYDSNESHDMEISHSGKTFSLILTPVKGAGYVNLYGRDVTDLKKTVFEFKKLSMAMEQSVNIVFITNFKGTIEYVNPMFEQVTGYSKDEAIGQTPRILSSGEVSNEKYEELWNTISAGKTWRNVYKNKKKTGGYYWCNSVISPIKDEKGQITHFLAVQEDTTEKMMSEERINYLAHHDELTGLMNRSRLIELLDDWIFYAQSSGDKGAFFLIDMDEFKFLNDTYGHGIGDEFLRRVGRVLESAINRLYEGNPSLFEKRPLIGRLSGDEFAVFLPRVEEKAANGIAESLRKEIEEFRFPEAPAAITISTGVVLYPEHGNNARELFTRADAAMYRAKELGRNRTHIYRPADQDLEKMHSRLAWKERILKALKEGRFVPWFQPILDLKDNAVHHYEALARLMDADGSVLLPGAFIDIAERFGIIGSIDRMIIEKAMVLQASLMKQGRSVSFGMNLSGKDLGDEDLLLYLQSKVKETGADPDKLIFEITETAAIGDLDRAVKFIKSLKSLGCHFALDDFGVGFTSFTYLREMQVDYIKIDGSFIKKLHESQNDRVFVKAMTDVAKGLKIKAIAEFVEKEETLKLLRELGVDFAQGYLIGKPAPPASILAGC